MLKVFHCIVNIISNTQAYVANGITRLLYSMSALSVSIFFLWHYMCWDCHLLFCSFGWNEVYNGCTNMIINFVILFLLLNLGENCYSKFICYFENASCACPCSVTYHLSIMYCRFYLRNIATIEGLIRIQIMPQIVSFAWLELISHCVQMIAWYSDGMFYFSFIL